MNELNNTATATGTYNSVPTSLTSNATVVNMIDGLTLVKSADKKNWVDGNLTYTITINNQTANSYETPVVKDVLEDSLVEFVTDSVTINGVIADKSKYSYDEGTHTLTVNLEDVSPSSSSVLTFQVNKKT